MDALDSMNSVDLVYSMDSMDSVHSMDPMHAMDLMDSVGSMVAFRRQLPFSQKGSTSYL